MKRKHKNFIGFTLIALCVTLISAVTITPSQADDADPHMTGLRERTKEELEHEFRTVPRVRKVRLNKLGLGRVNEKRHKDKLPKKLSTYAPLGLDLITTVGEGNETIQPNEGMLPEDMPTYVDNSVLKYFPPIRSQGSLPACGVFAGTYYTMTYMQALIRDLNAKTGGDTLRLSPKWTYNMVNNGETEGTWHYEAYDIGIKHGCATWSEFPYVGSTGDPLYYRAWSLNPQVWKNAIARRFNTFGYLYGTDTDEGMLLVKEMLTNGYILNFATYISSWQWKTISDDPSTAEDDAFVGKRACFWVNGTAGFHAMTVVGFNDDIWVDINTNGIVDQGEKGAFRIANSWGTGWEEAGFSWMSYDALRKTSTVNGGPSTNRKIGWTYGLAHWVTSKPPYQPKILAEFTLQHAKRKQMSINIGISNTTLTTPSSLWSPKMLQVQGGDFAFDGTTTACNATFAFDFTDMLPSDNSVNKYYLRVADLTADAPCLVTGYKIIDYTTQPPTEITASGLPMSVDASIMNSSVTYQYLNTNYLPVSILSASITSGYAPLTVEFNGGWSYDPDGTITSYTWAFGDGVQGAGPKINHTFNLT